MRDLFDILNIMFERPGEWKDVTNTEKQRNFFLIQRRLAINFPMQANVLQHLKINPLSTVNFWQYFIRKKYNKIPGWMYTKGVKKAQEVKEKVSVSKSIIDEYARINKIDIKSVKDALTFYPIEMLKKLKEFQKIIEQK